MNVLEALIKIENINTAIEAIRAVLPEEGYEDLHNAMDLLAEYRGVIYNRKIIE